MEHVSYKTCSVCKENKPTSEFHIKRKNKDGLCCDCKSCAKVRMAKYYKANSFKLIEYAKKKQLINLELTRERTNNYKKLNQNKVKSMNKKWKTENKEVCRAHNAKRRAKKLNAAIGNFDSELKEIYKNCPKGFHVDHIVPLQGKHVSGLHVPWNLQYLTPEENLTKSNKV